MSMLQVALDPATVIVAVDPGKVVNRIWVSNGTGLLADPLSLPVARDGIGRLEQLLVDHAVAEPVIAVEATGSLHRCWVAELERRHPGSVRIFAPSETKAARIQLGSGRFKTDDRDCAALTHLARQGAGRPHAEESAVDALRAADAPPAWPGHRPQGRPTTAARPAQHPMPGFICAGWPRSVTAGGVPYRIGRAGVCGGVLRSTTTSAVADHSSTGPDDARHRPVLGAPMARIVYRRRRMPSSEPDVWRGTWTATRCAGRHRRARREIAQLLAGTDGQVLTRSSPGSLGHPSCRIRSPQPAHPRFPHAEHLYSATGLAPALYESATLRRRGRISRQGLAEHRDALMGMAWGLFAVVTVLRRPQRRTPCSRYGTHPGPRRVGPQRLSSGLPTSANPTTLR